MVLEVLAGRTSYPQDLHRLATSAKNHSAGWAEDLWVVFARDYLALGEEGALGSVSGKVAEIWRPDEPGNGCGLFHTTASGGYKDTKNLGSGSGGGLSAARTSMT